VDRLDFAIYRALSPEGEARFWAGRRVIDPTLPAREIAARVGVSENGVRLRIQRLAREGYLRDQAVTPNPSLFGARTYAVELPVREVGEVERIYRDLALVEGVIFARDTLDEGTRRVRVYFVADGEASAARRTALLARLSPGGKSGEAVPYWIPACERDLTPLDWKVLGVVWGNPEASLPEIARAVRVSPKTARRRYRELVDSRACWWTHGPNSEEFPLALLQVAVRGPSDRETVDEALRTEATPWMPVARDGLGAEPGGPETEVARLVPADAPVGLERLVRKLAALAGITGVRRTFALGSTSYRAWFAERVSERVPGPRTPARSPARKRRAA
jgi:DNA-binding Lrp family transcriptional regulator